METWTGSDHDLAMQEATDKTVLGNFNDVQITLDGIKYVFSKKDSDFMVNITEVDGSVKDYKISYTFGVRPLQQYLVDFDKGKKQVLRVTWDAEKINGIINIRETLWILMIGCIGHKVPKTGTPCAPNAIPQILKKITM